MKYKQLGSSGLNVSEVCLGTMTWGFQNSQADADKQMALALEQGINFIDTAEMYPMPPSPDNYGRTEDCIGDWLSRNATQRGEIILASKIAGPGLHWVREGGPITGEAVIKSVDQSLARLQTDYIDLYQLHWPNRPGPHFSKHWPNSIRPSGVDAAAEREQMHEILDALHRCIQSGKIRHVGLSDETCWGIHTYLNLSKEFSLPKIVSIQNEFSLLHTKDWPYLIETCAMEDVAYLPWSPLAGGALSGKYLNGARPEGSRWSFSQRHGLFRDTEMSNAAISAYSELAKDMGCSMATLALAWCAQVDGVTSTIIGATSVEQLSENIAAFDVQLNADQMTKISEVHKTHPVPF
jgi:aryl-alcohol dehydrogenase-like predicted oxidoreductase